MPGHITRSGFLGATLALTLAPGALADAPADSDLANARLLVALELLLADFYGRALKADRLGLPGRDALRRAQFNETEHLAAVSGILTGAGQTPATAGDIDFSYPGNTFGSRGAIARTAATLERLAVGAYLGAVQSAKSAALTLPLARIAAVEARHLTVFAGEATGHPLDNSFGDALSIDVASAALGAYTS
jgi:ferritin-like protein